MTTDSKAVCGGDAFEALAREAEMIGAGRPPEAVLMAARGIWHLARPDGTSPLGGHGLTEGDCLHFARHALAAALASTAGAGPATTAQHLRDALAPHASQDGTWFSFGLSDLDALSKRLPAGAGAGDWQPIGSFPQDGNSYLAINAGLAGDGHMQVLSYDEDGRLLSSQEGLSYSPEAYTHWHTLPVRPDAPAVPASPRSETVWDYTHALQSVIWRICNGRPITDDLIKQAPHAAGMAAKFMAASPPAPAEHGAEISRLRSALEFIAEAHDAGRHDGVPEPCPAHDADTMWGVAVAALSQGGGAGRSERAVEIRERADAVFVIVRTTGEYSDRSEDLIAATFDGEAAKRWVEETQRVCQALAAETNRARIEANFENEQAIIAAAKARCPDPTFEPWGGYAEDVRYSVWEIKIGLPAPAQSPSTSDAEG